MSPRIAAVLLVPAEGDPLGLLTPNCGAWPPAAWIHADPPHPWVLRGLPEDAEDFGDALVLAWDGKAVAEGCDRADWCRSRSREQWVPGWVPGRDVVFLVMAVLGLSKRQRAHCATLAAHLSDLGTLIFLDADGREVTL